MPVPAARDARLLCRYNWPVRETLKERSMTTAVSGERETWRDGVETRMLVAASNGARELCIFEQWVAPRAGAPSHFHQAEEVLTVLEGEADVWVDGKHASLRPGQSVIVPARSMHGFNNTGTGTLHVHAVLAESSFEVIYEGRSDVVRRWQG
jgi:mannose-6-phosphate isomerase-like protein (cupin superfamily)